MAGFRTHITVSTLAGVGYGAAGAYAGLPWESAVIAGGLCGVGGMLPDIDSDSGVPFREAISFAAAIVPMLMLSRLAELGLNYEQMVLAVGGTYVFVRFGIARLFSKYTVHRGMFHSIPAALIFAGLAFLISGSSNLQLRYFKAAGVLLGVMSHLVLDEMYSVEWTGGRWRFKRSFGTALKLWGDNTWANFSTYAKLTLVVMLILSEPMVMEKYGRVNPWEVARGEWPGTMPEMYTDSHWPITTPNSMPVQPGSQPPAFDPYAPQADRTIYDTARRLWRKMHGETK